MRDTTGDVTMVHEGGLCAAGHVLIYWYPEPHCGICGARYIEETPEGDPQT